MKSIINAFIAGALFAGGLVLGGMTIPAKVLAFLDIFGDWDPSLAFVMGGAILVYLPFYRFSRRLEHPWLERSFILPSRTDIDGRLVVGALLFGVGWGIGGYCPGPALTSIGSLSGSVLLFVPSMFAGFLLAGALQR